MVNLDIIEKRFSGRHLPTSKKILFEQQNKKCLEMKEIVFKLLKSPSFAQTVDFYILNRSITSHNKKSLQKSRNTQEQKIIFTDGKETAAYLLSHLTKLLLTSHNMNYPRKNTIYLKQVYTSLSNQIKIENPKSSLPLKKFSFRL